MGKRKKVYIVLEVSVPEKHTVEDTQWVIWDILDNLQPAVEDFQEYPESYYRFVKAGYATERPFKRLQWSQRTPLK